jgi:hypothetical protein
MLVSLLPSTRASTLKTSALSMTPASSSLVATVESVSPLTTSTPTGRSASSAPPATAEV